MCTAACSWGASWGLRGNLRITYGAAYIMPLDYTYALEFGPLSNNERLEAAKTALRQGTIQYVSTNSTECVWYRTEKPLRLLRLHELVSTLALLDPGAGAGGGGLGKAQILRDLVAGNLGYAARLEAANTIFRVCGHASQMLTAVVPLAGADPQLDALLQIKEAVDTTGVLWQWSKMAGANGTYCMWKGLTCSDAAIQTLALSNDTTPGLQGTLPPATVFHRLTALTTVSIESQPKIFGTLPSDWAELQQLEDITIAKTTVSGPIPVTWGRWPRLKNMNLSINQLTGTIPEGFGKLTALDSLDLSFNSLTGQIPAAVGGMTALRALHFNLNKLSGRLQNTIGQLNR
jgi:hypothetical protein